MVKRYFSFFVIFLFLANSVGFGFFTFLQVKIHRKFEKWKEREKIVDLKIPLAEINAPSSTFRWIKDDEFTFNGRLYDVITSKKENGVFICKCYDDTKEGALYKKLEEHSAQNENNLPGKHKRIALKKGVEYDHAAFVFSCSSFGVTTEHFTSVELFAPAIFRSVASPPPWLG